MVGNMRIELRNENYNRLMKRREINFFIDHTQEPTPSTASVRELLSKQIDVPAEKTEIREIMTARGMQASDCKAFVWDNKVIEAKKAEEKSE
jgi:ribosomal protein S24E